MPKPEDKCKVCGHTYFYHATDLSNKTERCWFGCVTGNSCEAECKEFKQSENRPSN